MLTSLSAKNFTLIDFVELDFSSGLTVITGETGTGKSLILDALDLALGARAEAGLVSPGQAKAEIIASFDIANFPQAKLWLEEHEFDVDAECILRRVINLDGRSKAYLNDTPISLQSIKQFSALLVDIHSQHEQHALLAKDSQRKLLDDFAGLLPQKKKIATLFQTMQLKEKAIIELDKKQDGSEQEIAFLNFQLEELVSLAVGSVEELSALEQEQKILINGQSTIEKISQVLALCEEDSPHLLEQMGVALQLLRQVEDPALNESKELVENACIQLQEASIELRHYLNQFEINPGRLREIEQQLDKVYHAARKHHVHPSEIFALHEKFTQQLSGLTTVSEQLMDLQQSLSADQKAYRELAGKLSLARKKAANSLAVDVVKMIRQLGLPAAEFKIDVNPLSERFTPHGMDDIEFMLQSNPGHAFAPMRKIASGGELSRLSLALEVITQTDQSASPSTLIFDEVDVGIGGETAGMVGKLLKRLAKRSQIICITHLPQVAACGDHHMKVEKNVKNNHTSAIILPLTQSARVSEVARMLGGQQSSTSHKHAEALLEEAKANVEPL